MSTQTNNTPKKGQNVRNISEILRFILGIISCAKQQRNKSSEEKTNSSVNNLRATECCSLPFCSTKMLLNAETAGALEAIHHLKANHCTLNFEEGLEAMEGCRSCVISEGHSVISFQPAVRTVITLSALVDLSMHTPAAASRDHCSSSSSEERTGCIGCIIVSEDNRTAYPQLI